MWEWYNNTTICIDLDIFSQVSWLCLSYLWSNHVSSVWIISCFVTPPLFNSWSELSNLSRRADIYDQYCFVTNLINAVSNFLYKSTRNVFFFIIAETWSTTTATRNLQTCFRYRELVILLSKVSKGNLDKRPSTVNWLAHFLAGEF